MASRWFVLAVLVGCGASSGTQQDASAARGSNDWATSFIGRPPDMTLVTRWSAYPETKNKRRYAREVVGNEAKKSGLELPSPALQAVEQCAQADFYLSRGGNIAVLHGVPAWLDPARPFPDTSSGSGYRFVGQATSGTRSYRGSDEQLFVLPSSTWIVANGVAAERLAAALAVRAQEPPVAPAMPGSFAEAFTPATAPGFSVPAGVRGSDRITGKGSVAFLPANGSCTIAVRLVYPSTDDARVAAEDVTMLIARSSTDMCVVKGGRCRADALGSVLLVSTTFPGVGEGRGDCVGE
jgi:hypothetical protein